MSVNNPPKMENTTIYSLPNELIIMILEYISISDIKNFKEGFPKYKDLIEKTHSLWKLKFKSLVNHKYFKAVEKHTSGDWFLEVTNHLAMQKKIYNLLIDMTSQHYDSVNELGVRDMQPFFAIALAEPTSYCRVIYILQDHIKISYHYLNTYEAHRPYTLTEVYYAKLALRYLFHIYLTMKWAYSFVLRRLDPIHVLNFFVQWVDPMNMHTDEDVEEHMIAFCEVITKELKKKYLPKSKNNASNEDVPLPKLKQHDVVKTISHVIYDQKYFTLMPNTNLETLDLVQVLRKRCGNIFSIGAIYQCAAQQYGANCNLIAFPNHFIMEFHNTDETKANIYKIALENGSIRPKGICPYSQGPSVPTNSRYCPLSLLQYLAMDYISAMGEAKNWYTGNAELVFKVIYSVPQNKPYDKHANSAYGYFCDEIVFTNFSQDHLSSLLSLSIAVKVEPPIKRPLCVHRRSNWLKFAVGMICYHTQFNYVCLVRGWEDGVGNRPIHGDFHSLKFGSKQPFYIVIAMDQSERYVPQEFLLEYNQPTRLYHLEDMIAKEFTHFNGFAYVPNVDKEAEYPEDIAVSSLLKNRYDMRKYKF